MIEFKELVEDQLASVTDSIDSDSMKVADDIVQDVSMNGEAAVRRYASKYDNLKADEPLFIEASELRASTRRIPNEDLDLLERTGNRIRWFAEHQKSAMQDCNVNIPGAKAGHRWIPLEVAGCYAPAGRYPLPSSVLMTAITARVAGVGHVWVASPRPCDIMLAAAAVAGADGFLAVGGAQAIAAFSFGLDPNLPMADVIVGPGNRYVTAAKSIVSTKTRIDMLAGPSELVVVADNDAKPEFIAADLLAQAEHDPDARPILIAMHERLIEQVKSELGKQINNLPTSLVAAQSLRSGGYIVADSIEDAIKYCKVIAPEHLSLQGQQIEANADRFEFGAAVFIGSMTAEVFGDYGAGPNHVLPTGGAARSHGGLSVATFMKMQSRLQITDPLAAQSIIEDACQLGRLEGLIGHARSAAIRIKTDQTIPTSQP